MDPKFTLPGTLALESKKKLAAELLCFDYTGWPIATLMTGCGVALKLAQLTALLIMHGVKDCHQFLRNIMTTPLGCCCHRFYLSLPPYFHG